jgi:hypothetical protein
MLKFLTFPKQYVKGILSHFLLMFVCLHLQKDSQSITGLEVFREYSHELEPIIIFLHIWFCPL